MRAMLSRLANGAADMETTVVQRLGRVLYWTANVIAIIPVALLAAMIVDSGGREVDAAVLAFLLIPAVIAYLVGRALRYILANE